MLNNTIKLIDRTIEIALSLFMLLIVLAVSWQVITRYLFDSPSTISGEIARFSLIWIGMLGAAYCYRKKSHLSLNLVTSKFSPQGQKFTELFGHCVVLIFALLVMCVGGIKLVALTLDPVQVSSVLNKKIGYVYVIIPISGAVIVIYSLINIFAKNSQQVSQ